MLMNYPKTEREKPPVVCCECGKVFKGRAPVDAHGKGWEGFSYNISVRQQDGTYKTEHLGKCPECINSNH